MSSYVVPSFDMISDAEKEYHADLMLRAGNTRSPLFKVFTRRYKSKPPKQENLENILPDWVKNHVFQETNENDIEFRVITFKFLTIVFSQLSRQIFLIVKKYIF